MQFSLGFSDPSELQGVCKFFGEWMMSKAGRAFVQGWARDEEGGEGKEGVGRGEGGVKVKVKLSLF